MDIGKLVGNTPMIKLIMNMKVKKEAYSLNLNITTILEVLKIE